MARRREKEKLYKKQQKELHKKQEVDPSDSADVSLKRPYSTIKDNMEAVISYITGELVWVYDDRHKYTIQRKLDKERRAVDEGYLSKLRVKGSNTITHINLD